MAIWTDSHNHLQDPRFDDPEPIIAAMRSAGVGRCVVNATCEADWSAVEALALTHPDFITPAYGIHPWQAHTATDGWQQRLEILIKKSPHATVGECGLDRWVSEPSLAIQLPIFVDQLRLAHEMQRPVTIHCLKAWGLLLETFAKHPPPLRFLMHSFGGSIETARQLWPLGAFFSFSGRFLHPHKAAVLDVFRQLPRERILLETDAPDMLPPDEIISHPLPGHLNHPANLTAVGQALAAAFEMPAEDLAELTRTNADCLFG